MHPDQLQFDEVKRLFDQAGRAWPDAGSMGETGFLQSVIDGLCELSLLDPLTGVANRRAFNAVMSQELDRVARAGESALLLTVDIDHFKRINDTFGHAAGDVVIKSVVRAMVEAVRPMDTVARVGGEEFAVVLPNCGPAFGAVAAERIRAAVERMQVSHQGQVLAVTVSGGGAFAPPWVRSSAEAWMERADAQLYRAKREGRNRMCMEPTTSTDVSPEEKGLLFAWGAPDGLMIDSASPH